MLEKVPVGAAPMSEAMTKYCMANFSAPFQHKEELH